MSQGHPVRLPDFGEELTMKELNLYMKILQFLLRNKVVA